MIEAPGLLLTIGAFALVIGPLVFVHELGHYLVGRWFGVKADVFSIGFGREITGWTDKRGTRWKLAWLPLGGYVKFAGDQGVASQPDAEWLALPPEERAVTFQAHPLWQRALIVAAGPITNFLVAIVILAGFAYAYGDLRASTQVGQVAPHSAAAAAGIQPGDRILSLGGRSMESFDDLSDYIRIRAGQQIDVQLVRGGKEMLIPATIGTDTLQDRFGGRHQIGMLGVGPSDPTIEPVPLWKAPIVAVRRVGEIVRNIVDVVGQLIWGSVSVKELQGPIGMAKASGQFFTLGWPAFISLIALVSINLGFINLLPVPILDGGHLFFYAIEAVRRRPMEAHVQEWAFRGGLAAILALMLLVTFNDLGSVGLWHNLTRLIG